jgi:8-amino-7-oxononanoate synthase
MPHPLDWLNDALADLDRRGLRRTLAARATPQSAQIDFSGKSLINFGSNDYLGLAADPTVCEAAQRAIQTHGWGAGASALVCGRSHAHQELEQKIARFEKTEAALLFPTGFAANSGTIAALVGRGEAIFSDEKNHASIIDGCRLSGAKVCIYRHRDMAHLRELLTNEQGHRRLVVTDTVFSIDGDIACLADIAELAAASHAMLMVDEAHATGVFGQSGRGICEEQNVEDGVHIRVGTLSKALGGVGGFVAGSQQLIDWLTNRARPLIYSTAFPAAIAVAATKALEIVEAEPHRRDSLRTNATNLRTELSRLGFNIGASETQIIPVILGDPFQATAAAAQLRDHNIYIPAIRPPSVPHNQSVLRISLTYSHTSEQLNLLVSALTKVLK